MKAWGGEKKLFFRNIHIWCLTRMINDCLFDNIITGGKKEHLQNCYIEMDFNDSFGDRLWLTSSKQTSSHSLPSRTSFLCSFSQHQPHQQKASWNWVLRRPFHPHSPCQILTMRSGMGQPLFYMIFFLIASFLCNQADRTLEDFNAAPACARPHHAVLWHVRRDKLDCRE